MLSVVNINKSFAGTSILQKVSFTVNPFEKKAIVGPSGSGKSTLLHIISGLIKPSSGVVHYNDINLHDITRTKFNTILSKDFGFIFQQDFLLADFSVLENITICFPYLPKQQILRHLESLRLQEKIHQRVNLLSPGEKQRLSILRTILKKPKIIFADEITASLSKQDTKLAIEFLYGFADFALVLVTHDETLIDNSFNQVIRL